MVASFRFHGSGGDDDAPRSSMPEHEQHADFKAGHPYVFDDALGLDDPVKHMVEASLDFLPNRIETIATSAVDCECIVAEKLVTAEGRHFIFVRAATPEEADAFYGGDEDEDEYEDDVDSGEHDPSP